MAMAAKDTIPQTACDTIAHILEQSKKVALSLEEVENLLDAGAYTDSIADDE